MNSYLAAMRQYVDFQGRASRSQFWTYHLVLFGLFLVAYVIDVGVFGMDEDVALPLTGLVNLLHLLPTLAICVRRLHDTDRSGWWVLVGLVPFVGFIVLLVFALQGSATGPNRFDSTVGGEAAVTATSPAVNAPGPAAYEELERYAALRDSGAIDDAEYQQLKAKVLGAT